MAFTPVHYVDGSTVITAQNLNDIQDEIISQASTKAPKASPALTGTPTAPTAAAGTNTTQIATTAFVNTATENAAKYASNPTLLDNWYFGPGVINQRGQTTMTGYNKYLFDRWKTSGYASTVTELSADGLTIQNTSTSGAGGMMQYLRTPAPAGTTVTISVLASLGDGATGVGIRFYFEDGTYQAVAASSMEKDGNLFWTTVTLEQNCVRVQLRNSPNAATVTYTAAKLEVGDTQTLAHQENGEWVLNGLPDPTLELLKCQRYFCRIMTPGNNWVPLGYGYAASAKKARVCVPIPAAMANRPTISFSYSIRLRMNGLPQTSIATGNYSISYVSTSSFSNYASAVFIDVTISDEMEYSMTVGELVLLEILGSSSANDFDISCEQ